MKQKEAFMKKYFSTSKLMMIFGLMAVLLFPLCGTGLMVFSQEKSKVEIIKLPSPKVDGAVSVEKALLERRSVRTYKDEPLTLNEISQILWACQGITEPGRNLRTAPSPRAVFLLEIYVLPGNVKDLPMGIYQYQPQGHELVKIEGGDKKTDLFKAAGQAPIQNAPVALVLTGLTDKAQRQEWMYLEAGHAAQNIYLQAVSLKLGTVVMGGFKEEEVKKALNLPEKEKVIYLMPIGKK
jgi:SagB-type dehydrogenase family enzyme